MFGYKGFKRDLSCINDFQYEVGKTYQMHSNQIELCQSGFHFCRYPLDVLKYYDHPNHLYGVVQAQGKVIEGNDKSVTNQITLIKIIGKDELMTLMPDFVERKNGDKEWYQEGKLHRTDGPAIERKNGYKEWWVDGKRHRTDGPAIEGDDGYNAWYIKGKRHRTDGPAIERANGGKEWWVDGKRHRTDGPAIEGDDGYNAWYIKGKRHRTDGPAIERANGDKEWWVDGKRHLID
jgi:hypothetical protein